MLFLEQHYAAGRLGVERAGDVIDGMLDDVLDALVGDGRFVGERIDGSANFHRVQ